MNVLDLFSGIGGFSLGLERAGFRTVAFCEIDPYCRAVLRKHWSEIPIHDDIRTLRGNAFGTVDLVCGGFPCQPFSSAARGRNNATDLWPQMARVIGECRPRWVIAENVPGLGIDGIDRVAADLESLAYAVRVFDLDSAPFGRQRERRRIFFVADANRNREPRLSINAPMASVCEISRCGETDDAGTVGMDDGLPGRVDRLRALGNAVVPQIPEMIGRAIMRAES